MIVALYSDDPHEIRQYAYSRLRTKDLCLDCQLLGRARLQIDCPAGAPADAAGRFNCHLCIRQRVSNRLMLDDGMNTASPFVACEAERELKRCPHQCHRENSDQRGRASEASRGQGQTAAETPQYVITWYANPFESELRQEMGAVPHRIDRAFEDKAGCR